MYKYFYILLVLQGCASNRVIVREYMLPDGHTWLIRAKEIYCRDLETPDCKSKTLSWAERYGTELCGKKPDRVFACFFGGTENDTAGIQCYVDCGK